MTTPQQPELHRSRQTPEMDLDNIAGDLDAVDLPGSGSRTGGPVPADNRPGHHPRVEQDKPDLDAFAAKLGVGDPDDTDDSGDTDDTASADQDEDRGGPVGAIRGQLQQAVRGIDLDDGVRRGRHAGSRLLALTAAGIRGAADRIDHLADRIDLDDAPDDEASEVDSASA